MSTVLMIALLASPTVTVEAKPDTKVTCSEVTIPNSRFTRKECISKANAARRSKNAEVAWQAMQNATGPTPSEGL